MSSRASTLALSLVVAAASFGAGVVAGSSSADDRARVAARAEPAARGPGPIVAVPEAGLPAPEAASAVAAATSDAAVAPEAREAERLRGELARVRRDLTLEVARAESRASNLEQRVADLTRRAERSYDEVAQPDGVIVANDAAGLWIDVGRQHGLRRGTFFQVHDEQGGRPRLKALIEVEEVEASRARCAIEAREVLDPETGEKIALPLADAPLVAGDTVRNPFFDRAAVRTFAVLGTQVRGSTGVGDLVQRLSAAGCSVADRVDVHTDFAVLLDDGELVAPDQVERARLFGVVFMNEGELLHYLGLGPPQER